VFTRSLAALAAIEFSRGFKPTALQDLFPVASATIDLAVARATWKYLPTAPQVETHG